MQQTLKHECFAQIIKGAAQKIYGITISPSVSELWRKQFLFRTLWLSHWNYPITFLGYFISQVPESLIYGQKGFFLSHSLWLLNSRNFEFKLMFVPDIIKFPQAISEISHSQEWEWWTAAIGLICVFCSHLCSTATTSDDKGKGTKDRSQVPPDNILSKSIMAAAISTSYLTGSLLFISVSHSVVLCLVLFLTVCDMGMNPLRTLVFLIFHLTDVKFTAYPASAPTLTLSWVTASVKLPPCEI